MRYAVDVIVTIHLEADSVHEAAMRAVDEVLADGYDCEFSECREEKDYEGEDALRAFWNYVISIGAYDKVRQLVSIPKRYLCLSRKR